MPNMSNASRSAQSALFQIPLAVGTSGSGPSIGTFTRSRWCFVIDCWLLNHLEARGSGPVVDRRQVGEQVEGGLGVVAQRAQHVSQPSGTAIDHRLPRTLLEQQARQRGRIVATRASTASGVNPRAHPSARHGRDRG
jgi:hypothetical protein